MPQITKIEYACINIKGGVRETNQDNFYAEGQHRFGSDNDSDLVFCGTVDVSSCPILAVYDGMGGESCGEMASLIAASGTADFDRRPGPGDELLYRLCRTLNGYVCEYAEANRIKSMGTTAAIVRFDEEGALCCNLGDSRIYLIAGGGIRQISKDHSVQYDPNRKGALTQYLGLPEEEMILEPYMEWVPYADGNRYLICSDGITDMLADAEIGQIVARADTVKSGASELVSEALKRGGFDNITTILCEEKKENEYVL